MKVEMAIQQVLTEFNRASEKFDSFNSSHEGYAVLLEEVDELWEAIKCNENKTQLRAEAKQVAAMALRFMVELT